MNHVSGVMVSMQSVVDREFEPRSGQPKTIKLVFVASPLSMQHKEKEQTDWLGTGIMCSSEATWLHTDCCFSKLAL